MPFDRLGGFFAIPAIILCVVTAVVSYQRYQTLRAPLFQYATRFSYLMAMWVFRFVFTGLFSGAQYGALLRTALPFFGVPAIMGVTYLVLFTEYSQPQPNERAIRLVFFSAGMVTVGFFQPQLYTITWTGQEWRETHGLFLSGLLWFFIAICLGIIIPVIVRTWLRSSQYSFRVRFLLFLSILSGATSILLEVARRTLPSVIREVSFPFNPVVAYLCIFSLCMGAILILLYHHPTIFFIGLPALDSLHIVKRDSCIPLYGFAFSENSRGLGSNLFSMAFTGLRLLLMEALQTNSDLEQIKSGENDVLIYEGQAVVGFLVAKTGSDLLNTLLKLTVQDFELRYNSLLTGVVRPRLFQAFDRTVQKYFEFALTHSPPLGLG